MRRTIGHDNIRLFLKALYQLAQPHGVAGTVALVTRGFATPQASGMSAAITDYKMG
jgi:hypothetical protein